MSSKEQLTAIEKLEAILISSNSTIEQIIIQTQNPDYTVNIVLTFQEAMEKDTYNIMWVSKAEYNSKNAKWHIQYYSNAIKRI